MDEIKAIIINGTRIGEYGDESDIEVTDECLAQIQQYYLDKVPEKKVVKKDVGGFPHPNSLENSGFNKAIDQFINNIKGEK